ncbi:hypothetical protein ACFY1V_07510 [Streptomyces sp. NPDC001255]|uniref:hypothetical protein n=1 Tax=Streptomyces sp. NPDC001255 TaxID=3364550 RepID=UPI00368B155B
MDSDELPPFAAELMAWFADVGAPGSAGSYVGDWRPLSALASWSRVTASVVALAPEERRPDLYSKDHRLRNEMLLGLSGLGFIADAVARGQDVDLDRAVAEFGRSCRASLPSSEDWLLLDGEIPAGTRIEIGEYVLEALSDEETKQLLPPMYAVMPSAPASWQNVSVLKGAPFLRRVVPDRPLRSGHRFPLLEMPSCPELHHWRPLLPMLLWSDDVIRMNAWFIVEPGRCADLYAGSVPVVPDIYATGDGQEIEYERRETGLWRLTGRDISRLGAFCAAVDGLIGAVLEGANEKNKKAKTRARRLQRAAEHLLRAAHRTYGNDFVWEEDADEVTLHYVIAMEALLADEGQTDLSRKVKQRAAALWMTDALRLEVAEVVGRAYARRSKYAHGDDTRDIDAKELEMLRRVAHGVMLRWLVTTVPTGLDLPLELDKTLLSDTARAAVVMEPLRAFFDAASPALLPSDAQRLRTM